MAKLIDIILHLDKYVAQMAQDYGVWLYLILFLIVFCETGLVVTPFLPGDSLLFAVGALCGAGSLNVVYITVLLCIAAILGDTVNYWIGYRAGPKVFYKKDSKFLNPKHLETTRAFYDKYGGKTIILARFMPIVRTFAPFVAGIGKMSYPRFMAYNIFGGIFWVLFFVVIGYFFGGQPVVKKNFGYVIIGIIILSILPAVIEIWRERSKSKRAKAS